MTDRRVSRPETPRGRPRSEMAHRAVLSATARLLDTAAYEDITVEGIATEAGVGKQTIYRWWPNKAAVVLEAVLTGYVDTELAPLPHTGDLQTDLTAWLEAMVAKAFTDNALSLTRSLLAALLHSPQREELRRGYQVWDTEALTNRIHEERAAGTVRVNVDPQAVAAALMDPLIIRMITGSRPNPTWAHSLVSTVVEGLHPRP